MNHVTIDEQRRQQYDRIQAVNWSRLRYLATSPRLYRHRLRWPEPPKPSWVVGALTHCALLEPDEIAKRYGSYEAVRNPKAEDWKKWQAANPGVQSVKSHELEEAWCTAIGVMQNPDARELLRGGRREEAVTWIDEVTGVPCKGRLDYVRPDVVIDLKTARDPSQRPIEIAAVKYGYAGQLAFYHDGARAARLTDGKRLPFLIVPRNNADFDVVVYQFTRELLEFGRALYRSLLHKLVLCEDSGMWPGIAPGIHQLGLVPWAEAATFNIDDAGDF